MWVHIVARTRGRFNPFAATGSARWLWIHLQATFPLALAAVLMPDHLHLIAPSRSAAQLSGLIAAFSRRFGLGRGTWEPLPSPEPVRNPLHLKRQVRYVALNPCRARLCVDPLEWLWSTHRDLLGASTSPWVTPQRLAAAFGETPSDFLERHHRYVSSDPATSVTGTPLPKPASPSQFTQYPLEWIAEAAATAFRVPPLNVKSRNAARDLFIHLSRAQGWTHNPTLASYCCLTRNGVLKAALRPLPSQALVAASLCLGDRRLRANSACRILTSPKGGLRSG